MAGSAQKDLHTDAVDETGHCVDTAAPEPCSPDRIAELSSILHHFELTPTPRIWEGLQQALIHRSYRTEAALEQDNERLEFLGDSVIGLACTQYLLHSYPESDEGNLSKLRATVVSRQVLGKIAERINLGRVILLGAGEERSGGRARSSILGSALEAVCGALYLEYRWSELQPRLVSRIIQPALELSEEDRIIDHKSLFQEWAQREHQTVPDYHVVREGGPDHHKIFEVEVFLDGERKGRGCGRRKKLAENEAARDALEQIAHQGKPHAESND